MRRLMCDASSDGCASNQPRRFLRSITLPLVSNIAAMRGLATNSSHLAISVSPDWQTSFHSTLTTRPPKTPRTATASSSLSDSPHCKRISTEQALSHASTPGAMPRIPSNPVQPPSHLRSCPKRATRGTACMRILDRSTVRHSPTGRTPVRCIEEIGHVFSQMGCVLRVLGGKKGALWKICEA